MATAAAMPPGMLVDIPRDSLSGRGSPERVNESGQENGNQLCGSDSPAASVASKTPGFMERVQARVRPDADYREEIVRSIFGEVGTPVEGDGRGLLFLFSVFLAGVAVAGEAVKTVPSAETYCSLWRAGYLTAARVSLGRAV